MYKQHKIVMLPTDESSHLVKTSIGNKSSLYFDDKFPYINVNNYQQCQHLYVISNDDIVKDDWILDAENNLRKVNSIDLYQRLHLSGIDFLTVSPSSCKKIVATTNKSLNLPFIPDNVVYWFIKNNGLSQFIAVKYYADINVPPWSMTEDKEYYGEKIMIIDNYIDAKIYVKKAEWNIQEVESIIEFTKNLKYMDGSKPQKDFSTNDIIDKWLEEIKTKNSL